MEANLQTPHQNYGCYCNLLLWGRLTNAIQFVEVTYGKFAKILPKFENLSVSESRRGPDRETNEINLGCVEHNTTGHLVTHLVSFQYITCRVAAICTTYYSMLYFNFPRFEFQPFWNYFCGVIMNKCGIDARELPFNIRIYLKQNSKSLMSFILDRNTV